MALTEGIFVQKLYKHLEGTVIGGGASTGEDEE